MPVRGGIEVSDAKRRRDAKGNPNAKFEPHLVGGVALPVLASAVLAAPSSTGVTHRERYLQEGRRRDTVLYPRCDLARREWLRLNVPKLG